MLVENSRPDAFWRQTPSTGMAVQINFSGQSMMVAADKYIVSHPIGMPQSGAARDSPQNSHSGIPECL